MSTGSSQLDQQSSVIPDPKIKQEKDFENSPSKHFTQNYGTNGKGHACFVATLHKFVFRETATIKPEVIEKEGTNKILK